MSIKRQFRAFALVTAATAGLAAAGAAPFAATAQAGDYGCRWKCYTEISPHPIKRTIVSRVEIQRGLYAIEREPSHYGWVKRRVKYVDPHTGKRSYRTVKKRILLKPYKNIAVHSPGEYRYVREKVKIYPELAGWPHFSGKD